MNIKKRLFIICIFLVFLSGLFMFIRHYNKGNFNLININNIQTNNDLLTTKTVLNDNIDFRERYDDLFFYFLSSFLKFSTEDYALVNYPGSLSDAGNFTNQVEGVSRTLPLLAAWIYSGRESVLLLDNKKINIVDVVKKSILSGTDPKSENYWGDVKDYNQRILEASDIAKSLWLTRNTVWDDFTKDEKDQVAKWLMQASSAKTIKNNWMLSPLIIQIFLKTTGYLTSVDYNDYELFKENYLELGWFRDGKNGHVDFYNTWGITYDLFWIYIMDGYDSERIKEIISESSFFTSHLISKNGIPFMGRSMCYRTAIPSPIIINGFLNNNPEDQGLAKTALDYTWKYFVGHQALVSDTLSMGYYNNDKRFINNYSGSGSCLWGLRSLVIAFMNKRDSIFWNGDFKKLPVDKNDYTILASKIGWLVSGVKEKGEIKITINSNVNNSPSMNDSGLLIEYFLRLLGKAGRDEQFEVEYLKPEYSSLKPLSDIEEK